jgi:prephenate dehydrogenase
MKAAIIGGSGKMGRWFARYLLQEGFEVVITGRKREKLLSAGKELGIHTASNVNAVKKADVVIISVPIDNFEAVIEEIAPFINPDQLIVDITSIKTQPVDIMHRYLANNTILGTHPVFGPGARDLKNQNFVLTPTNEKEAELADKVKEHLEVKKANVSIMTPQEHDEIITVVLGLAHFIAIVSADTLLSFENFQGMKKIGGTTFKLLYTLIESVISEDPELYASLQMNFPDMDKVEGFFQSKTHIWANIVHNRDKNGFAERMLVLKKKLEKTDPEFRRAYENMYKITDKL